MIDIVKIEIDGVEFEGWQSVTISHTIDSIADSFQISGPFNPDDIFLTDAFRPFSYKNVRILIDNEVVFTGRLDAVSFSLDTDSRSFTAQGRSTPAVLADCVVKGKFSFKNLRYSAIVAEICKPFGIISDVIDDFGPIAVANVDPTETAFAFLARIAEGAGLTLTCDADGVLVARKIVPSGNPINIDFLDISTQFDGQSIFSEYIVYCQQSARPGLSGVSTDSGVSSYRPTARIFSDGEAENLKKSAENDRGRAIAGAIGITASVAGWRDSIGSLLQAGQLVSIVEPSVSLYRDAVYMIAELSRSIDSSGKKSTLQLVQAETYSGKLPEVTPWAQ